MEITRCTKCVMPNRRPDTPFTNGLCAACLNYARRQLVHWEDRKRDLLKLLDRHNGRVIVPSSGGKDSTYQCLTLKALGADVTAVTATTCHLTKIGRHNIDNLARHVRTIEVTPDMTVRAQLNRFGLELVGDISWPEHASIFSVPFRVAKELGINLIMYGENPQQEYGGPVGSEESVQMTRRWTSEFGGFLGLRPSDLTSMTSERAMRDYQLPDDLGNIEAHFLGHYLPWDSHANAKVAADAGMVQELPHDGNLWVHENLDNAQTGIHDFFGYLKYGYGRLCAQASVDVRAGRLTREEALAMVRERDGNFPWYYGGVPFPDVLNRVGMTWPQFLDCLERFTNKDLFSGVFVNNKPVLKEFECSPPA